MESLIDLHTHSYISDGSDSPTQVIEAANRNNLKALALTDHDSIYGIKEAKIAADKYKIKVIPGIEISSLYNNRIIHILGLGIDITNTYFLNKYINMKKIRENNIPKILEILDNKHNIKIDINYLHKVKFDEYLSRYDIYRYILRNKICTEAQKIWDIYLDHIPYEKGELIEFDEAIKMIREAKGLSFLAHYNKKIGLGGLNNHEIEEHIKYMLSIGLTGIERYYPSFNDNDYEFLDYLINKYNIPYSGGTDYHGNNRGNIDIGVGDGTLKIPYSIIE
ncbi:PHP domain-containing protein [Clostridium sp.]|uniref:PHP domain-containing protein n=1 Tax=Clostridium sp. TaxID=1506 RepID=UPI001D234DFB|nr:PHP domain-containing protein [Clostridium sp.]MBS5937946.1 PHP domain-containing protein [Clostridium sp.]